MLPALTPDNEFRNHRVKWTDISPPPLRSPHEYPARTENGTNQFADGGPNPFPELCVDSRPEHVPGRQYPFGDRAIYPVEQYPIALEQGLVGERIRSPDAHLQARIISRK